MITETPYRAFKELLCPVCLTFACPFHTPLDPQDNEDDGQALKGFAYNPFILEENFKRVKVVSSKPLTFQEEIGLQNTQIFTNIRDRLKRQKREEHLFTFTCKNTDNCQNNPEKLGKTSETLTKEEAASVLRLAIKIPTSKSCHINYLLGLDKCSQIDEYMERKREMIDDLQDQDKLEVDVRKYMEVNMNRFTKSKETAPKSRSRGRRGRGGKKKHKIRNDIKEVTDDRVHNECYNPCHHDGN